MTNLRIVAVNVSDRLALASDDRECAATNLFDSDGDETEDTDAAVAAVVRYADDKWFTIVLAEYETGASN